MRVRHIFFAVMLSASAWSAGAADYLVNEPGRWNPWKFRAEPPARKLYAVSAADLGTFEVELRALDTLIRRCPAVANPVGFNAWTSGYLGQYPTISPDQPKGAQAPLAGALTFGAFPVSESGRNDPVAREDRGDTQLMDFVVNSLQPTLLGGQQMPDDWQDIDTDVFLAPTEAGTIAGFPRYGDYLVIKKRSDPLWTPVSLETALRLVIASERKRLAHLEETRAPEIEIRKLERKIAGINAHIAALRPEDRAAATCWTGRGTEWGQRFQIGSAADCRPLVRPNWAYFDRRLPRSTPQVLLVTGIERCYASDASDTHAACITSRKLIESLDRQALLDWLH